MVVASLAKPGGGFAEGGALPTAAEVELRRCRRALLSAVFHGWADRVALGKSVLRQLRAEWGGRLERESCHGALLATALAEQEAATTEAAEQREATAAALRTAEATAATERAAAAAALQASEAQAAVERSEAAEALARQKAAHAQDVAAQCARSALLGGSVEHLERVSCKLSAACGEMEDELQEGERALTELARSHRRALARAARLRAGEGGASAAAAASAGRAAGPGSPPPVDTPPSRPSPAAREQASAAAMTEGDALAGAPSWLLAELASKVASDYGLWSP